MRILRRLVQLVLAGGVAFGIVYFVAGRSGGPAITVVQPSVVGRTGTLEMHIDTPGGRIEAWSASVEQGGQAYPVASSASGAPQNVEGSDTAELTIRTEIGKERVPALEAGPATLVVTATRSVLWGLRRASSRITHDLEVRLTPPRIAVVSTHHYINQGGAELVLYKVTPPDAASAVQVGEHSYPGFSAAEAGLGSDPSLQLAFFALLYDEPPDTLMMIRAWDAVGNDAEASFDHRVFPKAFRHSRIVLDDPFLARVVPAILQHAPEITSPISTSEETLAAYLVINGDMRQANADTIATMAKQTTPRMLWQGAFRQLSNSQVESGFADYRTYLYGGREVDHQVHLGFDLATTANAPVEAANRGTVVFAEDLGIYGNCVIVDHGLGVQSLYAHLSSFAVRVGDTVEQGQSLGRSGQTGLAGGDHLHFSMLVNGQFVNATEWWDPHWLEDRVSRKLREAGLD